MLRYLILLGYLLPILLLSSCQLDAGSYRPVWLTENTPTATITPVLSPTSTPAPTVAVEPVEPTQTATPTPSPTPTQTPLPSPTPIPSNRLAAAKQAYTNGNFKVARQEFDRLLEDPGADPDEKRQALYWRGRSELNLDDISAAIATLKMFLRQHPSDEFTRAAQFNLGRAYQQSDQTDKAINTYLGTIIPDDPVNVYIYEIIGDLYLAGGVYTETISAYQTGIDSTDDPGFKVHLHEGIAQTQLRYSNNPQAAITHYKDILNIAKIPAYRAKILRLMGDAYLTLEDEETAHQLYLEAVNNYPEANDSYLALVELVNAKIPVDEFQRGVIDYHAEAYWPAIDAFNRYLSQTITITTTRALSVTSSVTDTETTLENDPTQKQYKALWLTGRSYQALGQYNSAIFIYQQLIDEQPNSPYWGEAHIRMGNTLIDQENISRAKTVFRNFARQTPTDPLAHKALWLAGRQELYDENLDKAYTYLQTLAENYPDSEYAGDALYWAGQAAYLTENYENAIVVWSLLAEVYPESDLVSFGGYWRARALQALGQNDQAQQLLTELQDGPFEYYRLRARDRLNGRPTDPVPLAIPSPYALKQEQAATEAWLREWLDIEGEENISVIGNQLKSDPAFQRGDTLLNFGLRDEALTEFETVKETWWDDPPAMYQLAIYFSERQLGRLSILTSARLMFLSPAESPKELPVYIQRLYYPLYYKDLIFQEATNLDVDPALVAALIRQESMFEYAAESFAGARGLMQVMPATGEYVAERGEFGPYTPDLLWLPYVNIKYGTWYINQQLGIFEDNQFAAMAAYNAGPGNVLDWIKTSDDLDIFVETIPYWESRTYVRRVYTNLAAYQHIYGDSSQ